MTPHPLDSDDYELIQTFLTMKISLLLTAQAPLTEWHREAHEMQTASPDAWGRHAGFLFDYSLGRFAAAAQTASPDAVASINEDEFLRAFTYAVGSQNHTRAQDLWAEENMAATAHGDTLLPTTAALIDLLVEAQPHLDLSAMVHVMPSEFYPPTFAS